MVKSIRSVDSYINLLWLKMMLNRIQHAKFLLHWFNRPNREKKLKKYFKWKDGKRSKLNRNWNETTCVHKFKSNYVVRIGSTFVSVHFLKPSSCSYISASLTLSHYFCIQILHTNNPNSISPPFSIPFLMKRESNT